VLLEAGMPPHTKDERGRSPLHIAAAVGAVSVVNLLRASLPYSALWVKDDERGYTPLDWATHFGHAHAMASLRDAMQFQ